MLKLGFVCEVTHSHDDLQPFHALSLENRTAILYNNSGEWPPPVLVKLIKET